MFRLLRAKYAQELQASGMANRWNHEGEFTMYAGSSRSLSTLEMLVHRNGIPVKEPYRMMVVQVKATARDITLITPKVLPSNWKSLDAYPALQALGSKWYKSQTTLLLQVPSVIVEQEWNYLIHTKHPDFGKKVTLQNIEAYFWDERLVKNQ